MKKWIIRIVIVIIGLVFISLIYGGTIGEQSFEVEVSIDADSKLCWDVMQDPGNLNKWLKDFKEIEMTSDGIPGSVGTSYELTFEDDDHEMLMTQELIEIKPYELLSAKLTSSVLTGNMRITLSKNEDGSTKITNKSVYEGTNPITSLAMMFSHEKMVESQQESYLKLKELIESE